jgi:ATP phosphoribosyltransferase
MLQGAIAAASKVGLMLNVRREDLPGVLNVLPALKNPTISTLSDPEWVAVKHHHRGKCGSATPAQTQKRPRRRASSNIL